MSQNTGYGTSTMITDIAREIPNPRQCATEVSISATQSSVTIPHTLENEMTLITPKIVCTCGVPLFFSPESSVSSDIDLNLFSQAFIILQTRQRGNLSQILQNTTHTEGEITSVTQN